VALTPPELKTLTSVCDTLIPSVDFDGSSQDFFRRSASDIGVDRAMADVIERRLEPHLRKDFRRLLRTLDSRLYNLLLTGNPTKFSTAGPVKREEYLQKFRDSWLPAKRTAFQGLKRLTCFLFYTLPDQSGTNPNWAEIGYPGSRRDAPVNLPDELRIVPVSPRADSNLSCDVCIVGSGAGGSVIAHELSKSGYDVMVVEAGSYGTPESFKQSELSMLQEIFQQNGTAATKDLSYTLLAGRGSGGGTSVNWNTCLKPPAEILLEWEDEFGVSGVKDGAFASHIDEVWRTLRVGTGESQMNWNNMALWEGCKALGFREGTDFEMISRNAVGCDERCDFCTYGCRYACKQSTTLNYLPMAFRNGARFLFNTKVESIEVEKGRAKGVEARFKDGERQVKLSISARVVVSAGGGLETPALLLRSGIKNRLIGKFLRLDPTAAVVGIFSREVKPWAGPPETVVVRKFLNRDGTWHGFFIEAAPAHPGLFAFSVPWVDGRSHKEFMRRYAHSTASIVLLREWGSGAVEVDSHGSPIVSYELDKRDRENLLIGMETTGRIIAAAGANELWTTHSIPLVIKSDGGRLGEKELDEFSTGLRRKGLDYNRMMLYSAHLMGSCRMSSDPSLGPTKPTGELYDVDNLFVGDACVFPTTPGVNPMITIMAMARRTAEFVKDKLAGGA